MKKVIAFDLDDTLAVTKSPIEDRMAEALVRLLGHFDVCVISGGKYEQFKKQVVDRLPASPEQLKRLHLMPTCGTRYYHFDTPSGEWNKVYSEDLTEEQKKRIVAVLEKSAKQLGYWEEKPYGDIIEDRGSQITYSALGQEAPAEDKYKWDPDGRKKHAIRDLAAPELLDVELRVGGTTSVDVTMIGIDKAYGMKKLMEQLNVGKEDILFIGDKLEEGGNDYPVKAMGIDCLEVGRWKDTVLVLEGILHVI
jgi:phosphomannomutase